MQLQFSWLGKLHCFCYHSSEVTIKLNQERSCSFRISMDTVCYAELPWERNWLWVPFPYISDWFVAAFWSLETGSRWKRLCTFCSIHRNVSSELGVEYELWTMHFIIESRGCVVLLDELITMTTKAQHPRDHQMLISTWWRHQMETLSALLALCAGNYSPVTGEFPSQRPVARSLDTSLSAPEQTVK